MAKIENGVSLEMVNVFTYRGKLTRQQMTEVNREMQEIIADNGAKKTIKGITATYGAQKQGSEMILDVEMMFPLDKKIIVSKPYTIKPIFRLRNAVKIRHHGNPSLMQSTVNELMQYIKDNELTPITAGYNVTIQEPDSENKTDDLIVDFYIGVTDSIL